MKRLGKQKNTGRGFSHKSENSACNTQRWVSSEAMKTNFRIGQIIRNKKTGTKANVTAICNDYIVAVSYDHGAFRLYQNTLNDYE